MTPEVKKALDLALEALEPFSTPNWAGTGVDKANAAITAIRKARSAPVQEQRPYAYANPNNLCADTAFRWCEIGEFTMPVYTTQPAAQQQWVGLTDEEVNDCIKFPRRNLLTRDGTTSQLIARAIEAKLKEKNT
jgi:hypothetical protein